jgi:hypothetical protein
MVDGSGYWVFTTSNTVVLSFGGWIIQPPPSLPPAYTLVKGWNLVGFKPEPTIQNEPVNQYLSSVSGSYDPNNVWIYAGSWLRATGSTSLAPGEAMWILMTSPANLRP